LETDLFRKMQQQLDQYSIGFPATESGIEIRILKAMFTEEEAALFTDMTAELETPESVARRLNKPENETAAQLETMAQKGLLFRQRKPEGDRYSAIPFIHGLLEFQINRLEKDTVKLVGQYINEKLKYDMMELTGQFQRTIPVQQSVEVRHSVAPYDDACAILRNQDLIVLTACACRTQRAQFGKGCGKPLEVCFMFGPMGEYYLENGLGRQVSLEEALRIQTKAQEAGLITQPSNARDPFTLCNCCGDCCGFLHALQKHPKPAAMVSSNYRLTFDQDQCTGCGICVDRCGLLAITVNDRGFSETDDNRCIGCGLCVLTCPEKARTLVPKPREEHQNPPAGTAEQMTGLAERRGLSHQDRKKIVTFGFRD
jgi:Na+-translocating ferredoxin:NAD+ oxidoreductase subunit B